MVYSETWVAWIVLVFFFTISWTVAWLFGRKFGAAKIYERTAGKPIVLGKDRIPERLKVASFLIRNVSWRGWSNNYKRVIIDCEIKLPGISSETVVFDKWVRKGEEILYQEGKIFELTETGELKFKS